MALRHLGSHIYFTQARCVSRRVSTRQERTERSDVTTDPTINVQTSLVKRCALNSPNAGVLMLMSGWTSVKNVEVDTSEIGFSPPAPTT